MDDAVIKERVWAGVMELTLKHIFAQDIQLYLADIIELMKTIDNTGRTFTESVLIYILDKGQVNDKEAFFTLIKTTLSEETGEKIMTIAEQLRIEGIQQGMQQGIQKGIQKGMEDKAIDVAKHLLNTKAQLDLEFIAEATGLSITQLKAFKEPQ